MITTASKTKRSSNGSNGSRWAFDPRPLRDKRARLGMKPSAFARTVAPGMSGTQIEDIEKGVRTLTVKTLLQICNAQGINPRGLFVPAEKD
jgi:DNA-binding Xre family transcriptional regulator